MIESSFSSTQAKTASKRIQHRVFLFSSLITLALLCVWGFPSLWYTRLDPAAPQVRFLESTNLAGWAYEAVPISKTAESVLAADDLENGEFRKATGGTIRAFSAKRFGKKPRDISLFSHTPDRCWTSVGWKIEPTGPEIVQTEIHGVSMSFERRLFAYRGQRELVYFGALVGGQPVPFRLNQYHSSAVKAKRQRSLDRTGTAQRLINGDFWEWLWKSFLSRRPLAGAQHYVRVSTPVLPAQAEDPDALILEFLPMWLTPERILSRH
jgi:hypothetical protein